MKNRWIRVLALVLCAALLCGCTFLEDVKTIADAMAEYVKEESGQVTKFSEMEYIRPDMTVLEKALEDACEAAKGSDMDRITRTVNDFYDLYDEFYTNYSLSDLHYCHDLTDGYWEEEYNFCVENSSWVDAALEELYYALAKSPCLEELESEDNFGPGFFDSYQGENLWDETFVELLNRESELQGRYYELVNISYDYEEGTEEFQSACGDEMAQLLVELIKVRREMAEYWGYDSYAEFATDFYYYRDYTVEQSEEYLEEIQKELVELYRQVNESGIWDDAYDFSTEFQTFGYVEEMARNMGGMVEEAFDVMKEGKLYDIAYGENKYSSSFEVYLTSYWVPFIFLCPDMSSYDHLTFAHEFGHFCNDYASYGSYAGIDVLEVFSQGMEFLSLCYVDGSEDLTRVKMADCLCVYVEQAAFADFELRMYEIPPEELSAQKLAELYEEVALDYGFDSIGYDPWEFVSINHYYTNPMYIISYVVSNDAALQLYQMELEEVRKGLDCFEDNLTTQEQYFLAFLEEAGLESPFTEGRLASVRKTLEEALT